VVLVVSLKKKEHALQVFGPVSGVEPAIIMQDS
jgi:hypothetical protein